jgi:nitroreductase
MTDFFELLKKRRSIRDFEDKKVPLEIIKEIIKESCLAPSSANGQPWRFIIVNNKDVIKSLSDDSKKNLISFIEKNPDSPTKKYEAALRSLEFNVFYNAPCLVFIVGPKQLRSLHVDCGLAACYFMFSASARDLGTCWIGLGTNIQDPDLLDLIGMPEEHKIVAPLIMGYPKSIPNPPERMEPQILKLISEK